jgi:hypothetical protein
VECRTFVAVPGLAVLTSGPSLTYVVPLRRWRVEAIDGLARYLRSLHDHGVEVIVVDGSDPPVFDHHARGLGPGIRHLPVDPRFSGRSGKVNGVLTGVYAARHPHIVLADDDVRYDLEALARMGAGLEVAHCVRPQNHFEPLPWHARWDTARTLINRSLAADFPGTLGVRREALMRTGGYDADVLFENLELMRTIHAAGGSILHVPDLYVRRLPPTVRHFVGQRVRQAYDSSAQPIRLLVELGVLPVALLAGRRDARAVLAMAGASVALAELGRRRHGGRSVFPPGCSMMAPFWVAERALCSWLALGQRLRGGVPYAGARFPRSATSRRSLRARMRRAGIDLRGVDHGLAA